MDVDKRKMQRMPGYQCSVPLALPPLMMLAAVVPESSAADSPTLNPGALSSHIDLCPHIAHAGGIIFTVGTEHANLPPAGVGDVDHLGFLDCSQRSVVTGLLL